MRRFLSLFVSLSLIVVSAPLPAWSQVSAAISNSAPGVSGIAGASAAGAIPQLALPTMSLTAPALSGGLSAPMGGAPVPLSLQRAPISALSSVETRLALESAPIAAASKAAAPGAVNSDPKSLAAARVDVAAAAGEIADGPVSSSRLAAARMMDRLLGLEEGGDRKSAVEGLPRQGMLASDLKPAGLRETAAASDDIPAPDRPGDEGPKRYGNLSGALKAVATFAAGAGLTIGLQLGAVTLYH
ncbi:MAG: hypothetical protein Q7J64_00795, partial [Elusimicrobiota bacterium]|nr:hypothetical protein [Elusimicrobiota bacterium]